MLNEGDLVKVNSVCTGECLCFFCINEAESDKDGIGLVTSAWIDEDDEQAVIVEFPIGEWVFRGKERSELILLSSA